MRAPTPVARRPLPTWALLAELGLFSLAYALLERGLYALGGWWTTSVWRPEAAGWLTVETPAWLLSFALAFLALFPLLRRLGGGWGRRDFGLGVARPGVIGGAAALLGLMLTVLNLAILITPEITDQVWRAYGIRDAETLWAFLLFAIPLGAALAEELTYRSYLQGALMGWRPACGAVIAAVAFAWPHRFQGWVPLLTFHLPGSLLVATYYLRHRNLPAMIAVHLLFDLWTFGVMALCAWRPEWRQAAATDGLVLGLALVFVARRHLGELLHFMGASARGMTRPWSGLAVGAAVLGMAAAIPEVLAWRPLWRWATLTALAAVWFAGLWTRRSLAALAPNA